MLMDLHPRKDAITVVNIDAEHLERIKELYPEIGVLVADARKLPFPDNHFDVVYSNAVIEHVGTLEDQQMMADEVMRVGRRWFVPPRIAGTRSNFTYECRSFIGYHNR